LNIKQLKGSKIQTEICISKCAYASDFMSPAD
jgi:hypothetical protein